MKIVLSLFCVLFLSTGHAVHALQAAFDRTPPSIPSGLTAKPVSSAEIALAWKPSTDAVGVKGYRVYRNGALVSFVAATAFSNKGLTANTAYSFAVQAYDAAGNLSRKSAALSATTLSAAPPPPPPPPSTDLDTEVLGQSQTTQWGPYYKSPGWQFRIVTGSGYMNWMNSTDKIWSSPEKLYSSDGTPVLPYADIERVIITVGKSPQDVGVTGTYESLLDKTIATVRLKYPNVKEIRLQPLAAGPNKAICTSGGQNVLTTVNLPAIEKAIATLTAKYTDVTAGIVPLVDNCNEFADSTGHLTDPAGRQDIAAKVTTFYGTAAPPPPLTADIGYMGCSMTMGVGNGLIALGNTQSWNPVPDFGGGGVWQWAQSFGNKYWTNFQTAYTAQPVSVIWWELCSLNQTGYETYDNAVAVIDELKRRIPGVTVYVSAQPAYDNPADHVCVKAGVNGPSRMSTLAAQLTASGDALSGPVMGPLDATSQLMDDCHANTAGEKLMGQQFINFFLTKPQPGAKGIAKGITLVDDNRPEFAEAIKSPLVDVVLGRDRWAKSETVEGKPDFTRLCAKLTQARQAGKQFSLVNYTLPPAWLINKVPSSDRWTQSLGSTIVPWNATGLAAMKKYAEAQANFVCDGHKIKEHPALTQVQTGILGLVDIREAPPGYQLDTIKAAVLASVKIWHDAYAVTNDPKAYYTGLFPLGRSTTSVADAKAIWAAVEQVYPIQHAFMENWDISGPSGTSAEPLKAAKFKILQACNYYSDPAIIKCTGGTGNTPKAAFDKIAKPLGVTSIQLYGMDIVNAKFKSEIEYIHEAVSQ